MLPTQCFSAFTTVYNKGCKQEEGMEMKEGTKVGLGEKKSSGLF
jgi:hypothetical protein